MAEHEYSYGDLGRMIGGQLECLGGNVYGYVAHTAEHELILTPTDESSVFGETYTLTVCPVNTVTIDHDHSIDDAVHEFLYADEVIAVAKNYA